jgi:predicted dehydrogenase
MGGVKLRPDGLDRLVVNTAIVGGGGGFIGNHHDNGMAIANRLEIAKSGDSPPLAYEVVASSLSSDPDKSVAEGKKRGISRPYGSYQQLIDEEAKLPDSERAVAVSIRLPNSKQHDAVMAFLDAGYHVVVDKPNALTPSQAVAQAELAKDKGLVGVVTFTYTGSPMVRELRHRYQAGDFGTVTGVHTMYPQGWTLGLSPDDVWRLRKEVSGPFGVTADLGATHCLTNIRYVTGQDIASITADLAVIGADRQVDNYAQFMFRLADGTLGQGYTTQVASGWGNDQELRIDGTAKSARWMNTVTQGMSSDALTILMPTGESLYVPRNPNAPGLLSDVALRGCLAPLAHGEGFDHWFGALYRDALAQIAGAVYGIEVPAAALTAPSLQDGAMSLWMMYKMGESHIKGGVPVDAAFRQEQAGRLETYVMQNLHKGG